MPYIALQRKRHNCMIHNRSVICRLGRTTGVMFQAASMPASYERADLPGQFIYKNIIAHKPFV